MSVFNRIAFMSTLLKDRLLGKQTPLVVVLNATFRCNLACGYCYGQYFARKDKDFTTEELLNLIDELADLGTRLLTLGGGEPLLRDDIARIIKRAKDKGIECGMNTNGVLIPWRIKELQSIDMITVSIDGPKEMNDANRGAGSFEKIMAGIDSAIAAGLKVHTTTVITRYNSEAVDWIVELAKKKRLQAEFNFLFNQSQEKHDSDKFMAENNVLRKAVNRIVELKAQGAPILFSEKVYRYVAKWPDYQKRIIINEEPNFEHIPCYAGRFMLFIDANGLVYPCVQLMDIFPALDFRKVGLRKAWENCTRHPCRACYFPCFNEFNQIMQINPQVVMDEVGSSLRGD